VHQRRGPQRHIVTGDKSAEGGGKIEKLAMGKVVYAESEKMLAFGPLSWGQAGRERIWISNPTKIDTNVAATKNDASGAPVGMDVKPAAKGK
jgi:hypothetical protein